MGVGVRGGGLEVYVSDVIICILGFFLFFFNPVCLFILIVKLNAFDVLFPFLFCFCFFKLMSLK